MGHCSEGELNGQRAWPPSRIYGHTVSLAFPRAPAPFHDRSNCRGFPSAAMRATECPSKCGDQMHTATCRRANASACVRFFVYAMSEPSGYRIIVTNDLDGSVRVGSELLAPNGKVWLPAPLHAVVSLPTFTDIGEIDADTLTEAAQHREGYATLGPGIWLKRTSNFGDFSITRSVPNQDSGRAGSTRQASQRPSRAQVLATLAVSTQMQVPPLPDDATAGAVLAAAIFTGAIMVMLLVYMIIIMKPARTAVTPPRTA